MPEYLDDPSVLTKDKLKNELVAHNLELPSGNPTKDVLVQLYLDNITGQNQHDTAAFSSDEELPPVVVTSRSRSSGRKAVRKTDKVPAADQDVTELTDEGLKDELLKHGVNAGPIVATTRKVYEKKLQKILDNGPIQVTQVVVTETQTQIDLNGNSESDPYSDKEDEVLPEPEPEPQTQIEPEPEPVPVVERSLRSRGKTPVTTRSSSSKHKVVEKIAASEQPPKVEESDILKELLPNDINSPTRIFATCRRPIKEAAGRPVISSDLWNNENTLFYPKATKTSSSSSSSFYTQSHIVNRVNSLPLSTASTSTSSYTSSPAASSSRPLSAAPPAAQTKAAPHRMSLWKKLLLLAVVGAFLFLVYQAMETDRASPFEPQAAGVASSSTA